jgi:acyl carrier protein
VDTRQRLRTYISETFFVDGYSDQESFLKSGIIDSTGMMELVSFLESDFGVKVEDHELVPANLDSIDNLVAFLERRSAARPAAAG